jgi:subtilisin family serine protease
MRKLWSILLFLVFSLSGLAQQKYWVYFDPALRSAELSLSQRAIDRRMRQGIAIAENDYAISHDHIRAVRDLGFEIVHHSRWLNAVSVYAETEELMSLNTLDFVKGISLVGTVRAQPLEIVPHIGRSAADPNDYGDAWNQIRMLNGQKLHDKGSRGEGIHIAVLDAGFFRSDTMQVFAKMRQEGRLLGWKNFVYDTTSVFYSSSHGTYVLSCMAADLPGTMIGTAPDASYWLLMSEEVGSETPIEMDNWIAAAEFADSVGADIINSSLGYTRFDDPFPSYTYQDMDGKTTVVTRGAQIAASKGILVVNSQGNEAASSWRYMVAPADGDSVLAVGAVDPFEQYAYFSSVGPTYDGRIKPNVVTQGQEAVVANIYGGTFAANGTSFAAPILSGMAACLWSRHPFRSNMEILEFIERSAHMYRNPNNEMGHGIPNFQLADELLQYNVTAAPAEPFLLYPNPASSELTVVLDSEAPDRYWVQLINTSGQIMEQVQVRDRSILRFPLPVDAASGLYYIRISDGAAYEATQKFQLIHEE